MHRKRHLARWALPAMLAMAGSATADDVSKAEILLCTTLEAQVCVESLGCQAFDPEALNVPRFINVDVEQKKLATTEASGERRETAASTLSRQDGRLVLQGVEQGRAWSLYIDEETGWATFAAAAEGRSSTVFSACTPAPVR